MGTRDVRVDAYIANAAPFARPILHHIRDLVHAACPDATETIKWGMPHFEQNGILCSMASFKAHAALTFWLGTQVLGDDAIGNGMGQFGKLTSIEDLPSQATLIGYLEKAAALNASGVRQQRPGSRKASKRPEAPVPAELAAALARYPDARTHFETMSPSHRREYCTWIAEAKRADTREKRAAQAIEMLAEGKARNWKYT